jgi:hypothetical protein
LMDNGEYVHAADWLMQLHALMSPNRMNVTFIIARISQLCSSDAGKIRIVRDALFSLRCVSDIVRRRIGDYVNKMATEEIGSPLTARNRFGTTKNNSTKKVDKDGNEIIDKELEAIKLHYKAISDSTIEIKFMLLSLVRDVHYSEFRYVSSGLILELWSLFQTDKVHPLVSPLENDNDDSDDDYIWGARKNLLEDELLQMSATLHGVNFTYDRLEDRLQMLESSMSMSILLNLLQKDMTTAEMAGELDFDRFDKEKEEAKKAYWIESNFDHNAWNSRDVRYSEHKWNQSPRTVWEMLGYIQSYYQAKMELYATGSLAQARSADMKIIWYLDLDISNGQIGLFQWNKNVMGKDIDAIMKYVLFDPWTNADSKVDALASIRRKDHIAKNADGSKRVLSLLDTESILRCGTAELVLTDMMHDEENRDETPKFLSSEAARIRFLTETHALRALHEGLYSAFTSKDVGGDMLLPFYSSVSQSLFKFSAYLHLWNDVPSSKIAQYIFAPARTANGIRYSEDCCGSSVVYTSYRASPMSALKFMTGGVFGPNRILSGLGYSVQDIFIQSWVVPPIFFHMPAAPVGTKLQTFCGFSASSAIQWGIPNYLTAINDAEEDAYTAAMRVESQKAQGLSAGIDSTSEHAEALKFKPSHKIIGMEYPVSPLEIEVVLKYNCELSSAEQHARKSFGTELSKSVHFLSTGADWRVRNVEIFPNISDSRKHRLSYHDKKYVFNRQQIIEDRDYDAVMQSVASKFGFACIDCSVCLPEFKDGLHHPLQDTLDDTKTDSNGKVLTLSLLSQALEASVKTANIDGVHNYDPCTSDRERCSGVFGTASTKIQDYIRKKGYPRSFVPCRIYFTLLTNAPFSKKTKAKSENVRNNNDDDTMNSAHRNTESRENLNDEKEEETFGNLSLGNDHLPRLVASTVWLSPQAATGIWTCVQKPGDVEKCYKIATNEFSVASENLRSEGLYIDAIEHEKIVALLSLKYDVFLSLTRYNTSLATNFKKLFETMRMCRHLLEAGEATTMDIGAFRHTMVKYVCLGLRLCILSPQCCHMRGGCHVLLTRILDLEGLLKLAPMPTKITQPLVVVAGTADNLGTGKFRNSGHVVTPVEKSWDVNELRKALGQPATVSEAAVLLTHLEGKCLVLLDALGSDINILLNEEDFNVKRTSQNYQLLDNRDVVHSNKEKMHNLMSATLEARDLNYGASIFDENGNIKPGQTMNTMMRDTSSSSLSSISHASTATGIEEEVKTKEQLEIEAENIQNVRDASMREQIKNIMSKNKSMEVLLGELLNDPDRRDQWLEREREFASTETGKEMAAKAAEVSAAAAAAAARNKKAGMTGGARVFGAQQQQNIPQAKAVNTNTAAPMSNSMAAAAFASKVGSVHKLRDDVRKVAGLFVPNPKQN